MDEEVAEDAAARPEEGVELAKLVLDLVHAGRLDAVETDDRAVHPIAAHRDDVADLAVLNAFGQFLERAAVTRHQADADLQVLGRRVLGDLDHTRRGGAVGRQRLLHEDVQPLS